MVHLGVILINSNAHVFNEIPDKNTEAIYILENNDALSLWQIQSSQPISVFADFPRIFNPTYVRSWRGIGKSSPRSLAL